MVANPSKVFYALVDNCQTCHVLQGLIDKRPRLEWAKDMQALFRNAIHLGNRREQMTARG